MTSYWRSIVTMSLSHVVSRIFNVVKCRDLEIPVKVNQGNWKWYHSIDCVWFPYSNFVPKTHRFSDIRLVSVQWLWNPGSVVTQGHRNQHVSIRHLWLPLNFLWQLYTGLSPTVSKINGDFSPKSQTALCILHPDKGVLLGFRGIGYQRLGSKTRIMGLPGRERCLMISDGHF